LSYDVVGLGYDEDKVREQPFLLVTDATNYLMGSIHCWTV